jgi:hypothetical protein
MLIVRDEDAKAKVLNKLERYGNAKAGVCKEREELATMIRYWKGQREEQLFSSSCLHSAWRG